MMGRQNNDQGPLFYEFRLDGAVPDDHLVRKIDGVLDLSLVHAELAPHYPTLGHPSVQQVLMIRMLIIGYDSSSGRRSSAVNLGRHHPDLLPDFFNKIGHNQSLGILLQTCRWACAVTR